MDHSLIFKNRRGVIATMHSKEKIIAFLFERELGIKLQKVENLNTDLFGTFTNEIKRDGDQLQAARKKALEAMKKSGSTIGVASEGSFGAHPYLPYVPFTRELVLFIDHELDLEITGFVANSKTNYSQKKINSFNEALHFAQEIGFPSHGVIVRKHCSSLDPSEIFKGITSEEQLKEAVDYFLKKSNDAFWIETDMRAMINPTRMKNIELATLDLIKKVQSLCPRCQAPGYEKVATKKGLPCELCGLPTNEIQLHIYECKKCNHTEESEVPAKMADSSRCNFCNP